MKINNEEIERFLEEFEEAVKPLEAKYGVTIAPIKNISYKYDKFSFKTRILNGTKEEASKRDFESKCQYYPEVDTSMYQKKFKAVDGKKYKLIGLNTKAKKNICIIEGEDGSIYNCPFGFLGL